jgi:hypothetical protein
MELKSREISVTAVATKRLLESWRPRSRRVNSSS